MLYQNLNVLNVRCDVIRESLMAYISELKMIYLG